jgi:hypothetical protein
MDFKDRIIKLLESNMTEKGFALWEGINQRLPDCWGKPTSSTGKYHKKHNGDIPSQAEHVYHLLYASADKMLFAVALHDSLKYGELGTRKHTDKQHDKHAADMVSQNKETFQKILTEEEFFVMEEAIRFHSGQWSTDVRNGNFTFKDYNPETMFIHMLDMMSTADLIQTDVRD